MMDCMACHSPVPDDSVFLTCVSCDYPYHLGKCSGVTASGFRSKGEAFKSSWKCPTCELAHKRQGSASDQMQGSNIDRRLNELNEKLALLLPLVAKVDALAQLIEKVNGIEEAVQMMSDKYDTILSNLNKQASDIAVLQKKVETIEQGNVPDTKELQLQLNELQQYSRKQNMEVYGFKEEAHENLLEKMNGLASKLELPQLANSDFEALHRLSTRKGKESRVLVRFASTHLKETWMQSRSRLSTEEPDMRFVDNLTPMNKRLLWLAREKGKEKGYAFVWQKNGHVLVRKAEGQNAIRIRDENDLSKIE